MKGRRPRRDHRPLLLVAAPRIGRRGGIAGPLDDELGARLARILDVPILALLTGTARRYVPIDGRNVARMLPAIRRHRVVLFLGRAVARAISRAAKGRTPPRSKGVLLGPETLAFHVDILSPDLVGVAPLLAALLGFPAPRRVP
ncbi:MAG: hypothetical protein A3E78_14270 [Alphaproteobacteria bacterium RIFCSPHIGHO2_12_FULL_63_12]|nr:MAG: hypothetical protein A3E78_14270 [Alphaproteobacteria bacterium RIFCSPHIGHO2_12_FULL_63_12]